MRRARPQCCRAEEIIDFADVIFAEIGSNRLCPDAPRDMCPGRFLRRKDALNFIAARQAVVRRPIHRNEPRFCDSRMKQDRIECSAGCRRHHAVIAAVALLQPVTEFGDPLRDPAALAAVAAWSPLHNLTEGTSYPATLVITSKNDRRVSPAHGRKMIAALQASGSKGPHLLLERGDTGHGGPARLSAHIEDQVTTQRFAAARTGLNFPPLKALFSAV